MGESLWDGVRMTAKKGDGDRYDEILADGDVSVLHIHEYRYPNNFSQV